MKTKIGFRLKKENANRIKNEENVCVQTRACCSEVLLNKKPKQNILRLGKSCCGGGGERTLKVNAGRPYIYETPHILSAKSPRRRSH